MNTIALYVHIPFCRTRCAYCAFNTYAGLEPLIPAYVEALEAEARCAPDAQARTLYFGGGTPSLLPPDLLVALIRFLRRRFGLPPEAEVTVEANPGTVDGSSLAAARAAGVNRLSLGAQSANEEELHLLSRRHTWADVVAGVQAARAAGVDVVNLDLIYGLPGQSLSRWQETLEAALALEPDHLSLYALTLEEGTPLEARVARGELSPPDDDLAAEMYEWAQEHLARAGYVHYELSNWTRPGPEGPRLCQHNLVYWLNEPYLGLGAGAASWWGGRRWTNVRHPAEYIRRLTEGRLVAEEIEEIPLRLEIGETMMMGLRLIDGVSDARFRARFGQSLAEVFGEELDRLTVQRLLEWDGRTARLTPRGRLLGNRVFAEFL